MEPLLVKVSYIYEISLMMVQFLTRISKIENFKQFPFEPRLKFSWLHSSLRICFPFRVGLFKDLFVAMFSLTIVKPKWN